MTAPVENSHGPRVQSVWILTAHLLYALARDSLLTATAVAGTR